MTGNRWELLVDPDWRPDQPDEQPPSSAVVGGWVVSDEGVLTDFEPNVDYVPLSPDSPADPVDATLHRIAEGVLSGQALISVLRRASFGVAVDEAGDPVVTPAPDDVPSLVVTTARTYRDLVDVPGWIDVDLAKLAELLAALGADAWLNPGAAATTRLREATIARAATDAGRGPATT